MWRAVAIVPCLLGGVAAAAADLDARRAAVVAELDSLPPLLSSPQTCQRIGFHGLAAEPAWIVLDLGRPVTPERVAVFPARLPGTESPQSGFPSALAVEISDDAAFATKVEIAAWREPEPEDGERLPFWMTEGNGATGRYLRIVVTGFRTGRGGDRFFRMGEIVVLADGQNVALDCPVQTSASLDTARRWEPQNLNDGYFWCLPLRAASGSPAAGGRTRIASAPLSNGATWIEVDLGQPEQIDEIHLVPAHPPGQADLPGYGFPPNFELLADAETTEANLLLDELSPPFPAEGLPNPGLAQVMIATPGVTARRVRLAAHTLWRNGPQFPAELGEFVLALSELQCWRGGRNLAAGKPVTISDSAEGDGWSAAAVTDGFSSRHELLDWKSWLDGIALRVEVEDELARIDERLTRRREDRLQRLLTVAIGSLVALALAGTATILWLRASAAKRLASLQTRLARDLHDEIGASLSDLAIQSDLARQQHERHLDPGPRLAEIAATARETLDHMRDVIWLLAPRAGTWGDLSHRLESVADRLLHGIDHEVRVTGEPPDGRPAPQWARDAVLFLKEAITNARRHGGGERIAVGIEWSNGLVLTVADDGDGFDPETVATGHGLENLRARAAAMQARYEIESRLGRGTTVRLSAMKTEGNNSR
jgi:signal transduction histidine kinase